jgi:quercetin dioxygenase-like cupin family protein
MRGVEREETTGTIDAGRDGRPDSGGQTGREGRSVRPSLEVLDIGAEGVGILSEPEWAGGDRNSKTLLKTDSLRVVLTALRAGAVMDNADPDESITVHGFQGTIRVSAAGSEAPVRMGQLVCLAGGDPWRITADTDSLFLLVVGRSEAKGASEA